jgi:6-methylsalicylic acid synthase
MAWTTDKQGGWTGRAPEPATSTTSHNPEPVAIVGMGCRLPGGIGSPNALWELLDGNRDVIGEVPAGRWESYAARGPGYARAVRRAVTIGGYLDDIAGFDADFFGISPREAELMDPQQRVTLEVAWETLEQAGIAPGTLAGTNASVFMGVCCDDYGRQLLEDLPPLEAWTGIGSSMCAVANRVSYALDLRGPSVVTDTACSASLVALHQACQALRSGETSLALAGGVMLVASPSFALVLEAAGALSPDGNSRAFDAAANGYIRSEGCAMLALKRLSDARRDGDRVLALVRGSAVCQDGRTNGIMAPSQDAQAHLVRQACRNAGVPLTSVDYVEAHGTGTALGDPIEAGALAATVGRGRRGPCLIGSVKTNIGHLEAASGVAGIIKVALALRHDRIPATLPLAGLNPDIDWDGSGLKVVTENTPWPRSSRRPRRAGVGNYGYGGTLAHVIIEEAPEAARRRAVTADTARLFPLSAASQAGLRANAARLAAWLAGPGRDTSLNAVGWTLARGRSALAARACVVATDRAGLAARLGELAQGRRPAGPQARRGAVPPGPVWVFSGHGARRDRRDQGLAALDRAQRRRRRAGRPGGAVAGPRPDTPPGQHRRGLPQPAHGRPAGLPGNGRGRPAPASGPGPGVHHGPGGPPCQPAEGRRVLGRQPAQPGPVRRCGGRRRAGRAPRLPRGVGASGPRGPGELGRSVPGPRACRPARHGLAAQALLGAARAACQGPSARRGQPHRARSPHRRPGRVPRHAVADQAR